MADFDKIQKEVATQVRNTPCCSIPCTLPLLGAMFSSCLELHSMRVLKRITRNPDVCFSPRHLETALGQFCAEKGVSDGAMW